nr:hypothetical protein [Variovorax sp. Root318D1]
MTLPWSSRFFVSRPVVTASWARAAVPMTFRPSATRAAPGLDANAAVDGSGFGGGALDSGHHALRLAFGREVLRCLQVDLGVAFEGVGQASMEVLLLTCALRRTARDLGIGHAGLARLLQSDTGLQRAGVAVVQLRAFAVVNADAGAGLLVHLVEVSWQGLVGGVMKVAGDVTAIASPFQVGRETPIDANFALQPVRGDGAHLNAVALGLQSFDGLDGTVCMTQCGVDDQVASPCDGRIAQLAGPAARVVARVAGPGVGVGFAQLLEVRVKFALCIGVDGDDVLGKLFLCGIYKVALAGAWLARQNDSVRLCLRGCSR